MKRKIGPGEDTSRYLIIGVAAVLTLALPLSGWAADYCGLCEPGTEVEYCSISATGATH